mmetsp:Transcript_9478/g.35176  ORF Transcript_9478/g.35176 Transcript_9478/m.35176 type:complete len:328 (+) Transcript_9478:110-1093(+)
MPQLSKPPILKILFQSLDIVIVEKPHNINIDGNQHEHTVESLLQEQHPHLFERDEYHQKSKQQKAKRSVRFVHQLDFPTSGVLCLAMERKVCASIARCFQDRTVKKRYSAVVLGWIGELELHQDNGAMRYNSAVAPREAVGIQDSSSTATVAPFLIESLIGYDPDDEHEFLMKWYDRDTPPEQAPGARNARTRMHIVQRGYCKCLFPQSDGNGQTESRWVKATRVRVDLLTGRRHQIRVHLSHIGHPIIGDETYNGPPMDPFCDGDDTHTHTSTSNRLMLHSCYLEIPLDLNENKKPYKRPHMLPQGLTVIETEDPFDDVLRDHCGS